MKKTSSPHQTLTSTDLWFPRADFRSLPIGGVVGGLLLLLLLACAPSQPRGVLSEEKMTDVLVDIHLAQGMAETQGDVDVTRFKYIQAVFKKHRITEAEFDSSMVYYSGRAEEFTHIYNNVVTRVQAQAERLGLETATQDQFASITNEGDTANIWLGKDFACITGNPKLMLGTNTPSITSRCNQSALLLLIIPISRSRFPKSAARREGETIITKL